MCTVDVCTLQCYVDVHSGCMYTAVLRRCPQWMYVHCSVMLMCTVDVCTLQYYVDVHSGCMYTAVLC